MHFLEHDMGLSRYPYEVPNTNEQPVKPLLELRQLSKHFPIRGGVFQRQVGVIKMLDRLNLVVRPGETVTLVGGHGAGKTTLARLIMQLAAPTSGQVVFDGEALAQMGRVSLRLARQQLQMTLQDPYAALNPKMMVSEILAEPLRIHKLADGRSQKGRVTELLQLVGLNPYFAGRYPHEFSGGQRQRLNIARALATGPRLLVVDDPLVALDTAVRPQIISLLAELKQRLGLTLLLLVSDLTHVRVISDRVGVLYMGELVELAATEQVYERPLHPYTQFILGQSASAVYGGDDRRQPMKLTGPAPDPVNPPSGCRFRTQCPYATDVCRDEIPPLRDLGQRGNPHLAACHHAERFAD
ncbi:MAG: ATP-binding cassette domain-containing protein [Anaerolineaceae bacterium]|nr:ATP-binding cassette domain-containing protein [Anaerolineaceae bacterium]